MVYIYVYLLAQNLRGSTNREYLMKETNICYLPTRSLEAHKPCHVELLTLDWASTFVQRIESSFFDYYYLFIGSTSLGLYCTLHVLYINTIIIVI